MPFLCPHTGECASIPSLRVASIRPRGFHTSHDSYGTFLHYPAQTLVIAVFLECSVFFQLTITYVHCSPVVILKDPYRNLGFGHYGFQGNVCCLVFFINSGL